MATSIIKRKETLTREVTGYTVSSVVVSPSLITVWRTGNVVQVSWWGAQIKSGTATGTDVIEGLPICKRQGTAHLGLAGANTTNLQGNIYNTGAGSDKVRIGLKSGYTANSPLYASLVYICEDD